MALITNDSMHAVNNHNWRPSMINNM